MLGSRSFRGFMFNARKNPAEKPKFMNLDTWETLRRKWGLADFVERSERVKVSLQANNNFHVGGSIPSVEHKKRLQKELSRDPTANELFIRTHKRKDNTFVDYQAKETWEQYNEKYSIEDSLDAESGNVSNTYTRWVNHVGSKKGRVYGLGSEADQYILHRSHTNKPSIHTSYDEELVLIQEMVERQQDEQENLRLEQDRLRVIQEAQTQKLDQVVQSQTSMKENLRRILTREMEAQEERNKKRMEEQTQRLLEAFQHRR